MLIALRPPTPRRCCLPWTLPTHNRLWSLAAVALAGNGARGRLDGGAKRECPRTPARGGFTSSRGPIIRGSPDTPSPQGAGYSGTSCPWATLSAMARARYRGRMLQWGGSLDQGRAYVFSGADGPAALYPGYAQPEGVRPLRLLRGRGRRERRRRGRHRRRSGSGGCDGRCRQGRGRLLRSRWLSALCPGYANPQAFASFGNS